jgi:uncharacterized Zn finger protein
MAWYEYDRFAESKPRQAKGGIQAQTKRGSFGQSWWAKRWIATLESFDIASRLSRGRSYARNGQVVDIQIAPGKVTAKVQGSSAKPYSVRIEVQTLEADAHEQLAGVLSSQALFAAKLLAGDMPQEIESTFEAAGLMLFPRSGSDLETHCSCPDWSNPCKHVAAVYYLLGEEFDRDPFLIFTLRGLNRERLLALLQGQIETEEEEVEAPEPPGVEMSAFWNGSELPPDFWGEVRLPPVTAALPHRLGSFPFWRGQTPFFEGLEPIYQAAAPRGLALYENAPLDENTGDGRL